MSCNIADINISLYHHIFCGTKLAHLESLYGAAMAIILDVISQEHLEGISSRKAQPLT